MMRVAFVVLALVLLASLPATSQNASGDFGGDPGDQIDSSFPDTRIDAGRDYDEDSRARRDHNASSPEDDVTPGDGGDDANASPVCTQEEIDSGQCAERLPRCPRDPRCPGHANATP